MSRREKWHYVWGHLKHGGKSVVRYRLDGDDRIKVEVIGDDGRVTTSRVIPEQELPLDVPRDVLHDNRALEEHGYG